MKKKPSQSKAGQAPSRLAKMRPSALGQAKKTQKKTYPVKSISRNLGNAKQLNRPKVIKKSMTSKIPVQPLGDRVLIKPIVEEYGQTSSGIIIPETIDREKPESGTVVAVGEGKFFEGKLVPIKVKVGEKVMFSKYGFDEVKVDKDEYYIVKEENILAVIN